MRVQLPYTVSLEVYGGVAHPVFEKGAVLPQNDTKSYSTASDNQSHVEIHLVYGEATMAADNILLGKFLYEGIPPAPRGIPRIDITISVSENLQLSVIAANVAKNESEFLGRVDLSKIEIPEGSKAAQPGDRSRQARSHFHRSPGNPDFEDLFEEFLRSFSSRPHQRHQMGNDVRQDATISFDQAFLGTEIEVEVTRLKVCDTCGGTGAAPATPVDKCDACKGKGSVRQLGGTFLGLMVQKRQCERCGGRGKIPTTPCQTCSGNGIGRFKQTFEVKVPAGIVDSSQLRLVSYGDESTPPGKPGDLYLKMRIHPHETLTRSGSDLLATLVLTRDQASAGGAYPVTTPEGEIPIEIPPGTENGASIKVVGRGFPNLRSARPQGNKNRGDLVVSVHLS
jgi:DnaJ-class molecular chaperone